MDEETRDTEEAQERRADSEDAMAVYLRNRTKEEARRDLGTWEFMTWGTGINKYSGEDQ